MSRKPPSSTERDDTRLRRLVSAWCDGDLADADQRWLEATLAASEPARRMFVALMHIHTRMPDYMPLDYGVETVPFRRNVAKSPEVSGPKQQQPLRFLLTVFTRNGSAWIWAAALLIGVFAWGIAHWLPEPAAAPSRKLLSADQGAEPSQAGDSDQAGAVLARVTESSDDCQWLFDKGSQAHREHPQNICSGDTIRATKGTMKLTFTNGTVVTLRGPALLQVISGMRARVLLGTVTANVATGAKGFSILTPRATVIDLGTEFGVQVNEVGATDVVVFQGEVNLDYMNQTEEFERQRLRVGEGMRLDARGTASRIVSITNDVYSDPPAKDSLRPPVITDVRDSILRGALNYYEIAPCGMREDAKAFADREEHEWNGVTTMGMPSYLLGGDYVKTFNNDKFSDDLEITVTLNRATKLYILFDKRIPAPDWLKKDFRDTGDEIGVDEGRFYCLSDGQLDPTRRPGVGPGVSVDNVSSIWVRELSGPCSVKLGSTESPTRNINMYGIVAVPMDKDPTHEENKELVPSR